MKPLTIGLPVYNGASTLPASLSTVLAQSFSDFTLLISDNSSTDGTYEICCDFMRQDSRISYHRQPNPVPWTENFRWLLVQAETPYFMWITDDDFWEPRFIESNIENLQSHPEAVCSVSQVVHVSANGRETLTRDTGPIVGLPAYRLRRFFSTLDLCGRFYGIYRTPVLRRAFPENLRMFGADWLIVALTLLEGDHVEVGEVLLRRGAQPPDYYISRLGKLDGADHAWFEKYIPLYQLRRELKRRLPEHVWGEVKWPLTYLDIRQLSLIAQIRLPLLGPAVSTMRSIAAGLLHRRWQTHRQK